MNFTLYLGVETSKFFFSIQILAMKEIILESFRTICCELVQSAIDIVIHVLICGINT